jgi:hypothetical protein
VSIKAIIGRLGQNRIRTYADLEDGVLPRPDGRDDLR